MEGEPQRPAQAGSTAVLLALLDVVGARSVVEVGAGASTFALAAWAGAAGGHLVSIDPEPPDDVRRLARRSADVTLLVTTGLDGLAGADRADAYLLDGDHNHYTVSAELHLVAAHADARRCTPLVVVGGTGWPWGRRDHYDRPEALPPAAVHPHDRGSLVPGSVRSVAAGWRPPGTGAAASYEGGPANGVRTAVEDWSGSHAAWATVSLPGLGGATVCWSRAAPWAAAVQALIGPLDDHPLLEEIDRGRVAAEVRADALDTALAGADRRGAERVAALQAELDAARAELAVRAAAQG